MKSFHSLTYQGQIRRLRVVAQNALFAYDLSNPVLRLLRHGENTTFRVSVDGKVNNVGDRQSDLAAHSDYADHQFLLRVHRPTYQGVNEIRSELSWLAALRSHGMVVPEPTPTRDGEPVSQANAPGVPGQPICSLLRWINGRFARKPTTLHFTRLGKLIAQLHEQAQHWTPPSDFQRRAWDATGLFGDNAGFALPAVDVWSKVPARYLSVLQHVAEEAEQMMTILGRTPEVWGLIHADLHLDNVLFARDAAYAIDFDDCGFAHWHYDLAVVLAEYLHRSDWTDLRSALLAGYVQVRPLPDYIELLPTFMAARLASLLLWSTDMAETNPSFAANLERWYERDMNYIDRVQQMLS